MPWNDDHIESPIAGQLLDAVLYLEQKYLMIVSQQSVLGIGPRSKFHLEMWSGVLADKKSDSNKLLIKSVTYA